MHCFVLLEVSFIQLKLNRVRTKQCYSISEFRIRRMSVGALTILAAVVASLGANSQGGGGAPAPAAQGGGQGGQRAAGAPPPPMRLVSADISDGKQIAGKF